MQARIEQEKSAHIHRYHAHEDHYIRQSDSREYGANDADKIADSRCPPYATIQPESIQRSQLHCEDARKGPDVPGLEFRLQGSSYFKIPAPP